MHGKLVSRILKESKSQRRRWHGLRLLASDKTNLTLPESPSLYKGFGAHKGSRGLGPVCVELCVLFDLVSRAPLSFVYDRVCTSEHKLIKGLIGHLKKGDLLLLDAGFYCGAIFQKIITRDAHLIIPANSTTSPKVLKKLGEGDYLCEIDDNEKKIPITVRVVYVHRDGFRRRRLVTSLLDPVIFSPSELARLYHMRWDIETFYFDFKCRLSATSWHCQTPVTFHQELLIHMVVCCLIRIAMLEASRRYKLSVAQISFTRAITETRLLLRKLLSTDRQCLWATIWAMYVQCCSRHRVKSKPNRQFSRDQQEYRRKSRGLDKSRPGGNRKYKEASPPQKPETRKDAKGQEFLLS